jgi:hypothetical protein
MVNAVASSETRAHFLEVVRCTILARCLADPEPQHPCASIALDHWAAVPVGIECETLGNHSLLPIVVAFQRRRHLVGTARRSRLPEL